MNIMPVNSCSYANFKGLNSQKVVRRVVNATLDSTPKGITKSPVRMLDDKDLMQIIGVCVGTSALSCMTDFSTGFSAAL